MNRVTLCGRLGADPMLRNTATGKNVCTFSLATSEYGEKDETGKSKEYTEWHKIVIWGKQGENASKYLKKGNWCLIDGSIKTRAYKAKEGDTRTVTEINAFHVRWFDLGEKTQPQPAQAEVSPDDVPF